MLSFQDRPGRIVVPWKPHAKQRARVRNNVAYTPAATRNAEKLIKEAFEDAFDRELFTGPIAVTVEMHNDHFVIEIVDCDDYENRKLRGDVDNYAKTILDSLNEVAWDDDSQIVKLTMEKI